MRKNHKKDWTLIQEIEAQVYPSHMQMWQDMTYREARRHGDMYVYDEQVYLLVSDTYIVDLAAKNGRAPLNLLLQVFQDLKRISPRWTASCRATTSFRLLQLAQRRGLLTLEVKGSYMWGDEQMYEVSFELI